MLTSFAKAITQERPVGTVLWLDHDVLVLREARYRRAVG